jgi:hypothetical protein
MTYRFRLPFGSGMGLTTSLRSLTLSPKLLARFDSYVRHVGSNLTSKALPGDEFAPEDIFSAYLTIMQVKVRRQSTVQIATSRERVSYPRPIVPGISAGDWQVLETKQGSETPLSTIGEPSFRIIRFLDELVHCWRDGDVQKGCLFALRLLQTEESRKRLIPS